MLLTWLIPAEPPDNDDGTVNLGYEVEVWNPATQTWDSVLHDDNGDENDVTVATKTDRIAPALTTGTPAGGTLQDTGLKGTTEYTYRVRAVDGVGTTNVVRGKWSTQESGTTVAVSPSQPMLTATAMGTNKIVLTWSVPEDGGDDIIGYILAVSDTAPAADADLASPQYLNPAGTAGAAPVLLEAAQQSVTHSMTSVPAALTPRSTWHYQISALNSVADITDPPAATANAAWSDWSAVAMATTGTSVPGKPEEFTVTGATGTFTLTFTNPDTNNGGSDYTSHELQMWDADREEWILLHDGTAANLILAAENNVPTELGANVLRYFRARSKNRNGAGPWETDSDTTTAGAASAPKLTATVNGPDRITLSWTVPENDGGGTITGYVIQFGADGATWTAPDATTTPVTGPGLTNIGANTLSATHTGLTAGQTVYYQVRATTDVAGTATEGTWSASVSASTSTGGVPGATGWDTPDLTPTATSMTIHWSAPQVGGADDPSVTGYDIAMWENGQWTTIASNIASDPTEYVASDLSGDTTYYFSVRAKNANGNGPWSEVRSDDTNEGTPGKPVVTATADGATKIVLTWTAPDSGGATINHYVVQVSNNGTIGWGPLDDAATPNNNVITTNLPDPGATHVSAATNEPAPPLTVTHSGLNGMQKRFYRVAASTAAVGSDPADADIGAWSDVVYETTPAGEPGAPTWPDDDNDPSNGFNALTVTSSSITVAWTAPTANGGSVITGYQIQIWEDGAWMDLMSVGDSTTSYMHSGLPGATQNFYRVRAMNSVGYSKWSATHNGTTSDGKPGAPMLHADQNGSTQIRLTWTAPATGAAADTVVISNFQIQVSSDGQSGWTTPDADPATPLNNIVSDGERVLQTAAAGSTAADTTRNYTDSDLDPATTMYYRVRAVNSAGAVGPWSNKAMASTLGGRPGRPALTATASGTSIINLAWTPPTGDGGSAVTGYDLQYWDGSNGWMDLAEPGWTA